MFTWWFGTPKLSRLLYFKWSPPWHIILTFFLACYLTYILKPIWQSIWHSISHSVWHSIWHSIWHSVWHSIWHSIWHKFWHSILHLVWNFIWHSFWHMLWRWHSITLWHSILAFCRPSVLTVYLGPRGKGQKLAWQGAWHENTKGAAQLRSFFINVDGRVWSWGVLVRWTSKPTYWGDVCWRGRGWEHMIMNVPLHEEDKEIQHSQHDD